MISVDEARDIIREKVRPATPAIFPLRDCAGLTSAENVTATQDIPAYAQSSMDGYAFAFVNRDQRLQITHEMVAGTPEPFRISGNEAVRIFTGAPLPDGADTVVMQEKSIVEEGKLLVNDPTIQPGSFVRPVGAEVRAGDVAFPGNTMVSVASLGFLASIGIQQVPVYPPPVVTIILTGNELQQPGQPLGFGKVYDANSVMLRAALEHQGVSTILLDEAKDDLSVLQSVLTHALNNSDLILLTGGVSVGDYDYVTRAADLCGIQTHFHRVKQKPGKPLFFGSNGNKLVFGLPGNPSSALTCFYVYVTVALNILMQKKNVPVPMTAKLTRDFDKVPGLTQFLKASWCNGEVSILHAQESFRLHSFARANCLVELREEKNRYVQGEAVTVHILPR